MRETKNAGCFYASNFLFVLVQPVLGNKNCWETNQNRFKFCRFRQHCALSANGLKLTKQLKGFVWWYFLYGPKQEKQFLHCLLEHLKNDSNLKWFFLIWYKINIISVWNEEL